MINANTQTNTTKPMSSFFMTISFPYSPMKEIWTRYLSGQIPAPACKGVEIELDFEKVSFTKKDQAPNRTQALSGDGRAHF